MSEKILRASKIGFPCLRNLWYSVNGFRGNITTKTQRIFDVGTILEPLIVDWLQNDGWFVDYNIGSQNANLEFKIPVKGGFISGHPDCFISRDNLNFYLIDIKTMNERAYIQWKRQGSLISKSQYVDQIHVYALGAFQAGFYGIQGLGICGMNKNNADIHIDFFDFDKDRASYLKLKAEQVFALSEPPKHESPDSEWACRYCEYSNICSICENSKDTEVGNEYAVTSDQDVINAMELLKEARELKSCSDELSDEAKKVLDEKIRQRGIKNVKAGHLLLNITEIFKKRFDTKKFEHDYPELSQKYTSQRGEIHYNLK